MPEEAAPAPNAGRCVYGFVLFILCYSCLILYSMWALIPSPWLISVGLAYFSSKYWVLAIPVTCCMLLVMFGALLYPAINLTLTQGTDSISILADSQSRKAPNRVKDMMKSIQDFKRLMERGIPPVYDLDIEEVNDLLYNS